MSTKNEPPADSLSRLREEGRRIYDRLIPSLLASDEGSIVIIVFSVLGDDRHIVGKTPEAARAAAEAAFGQVSWYQRGIWEASLPSEVVRVVGPG